MWALRMWLIRMLAGRDTVVINADIDSKFGLRNEGGKWFVHGVKLSGFYKAIEVRTG